MPVIVLRVNEDNGVLVRLRLIAGARLALTCQYARVIMTLNISYLYVLSPQSSVMAFAGYAQILLSLYA